MTPLSSVASSKLCVVVDGELAPCPHATLVIT